MVLSVKHPSINDFDLEIFVKEIDKNLILNQEKLCLYNESSINIQQLIETNKGNAHQLWRIDETIGFIYSFACDDYENIGIFKY